MLVYIIQLIAYSTIMEFITTQNVVSAYYGCCFVVYREMDNGTIYWRCSKRTCPARITTQGEELLQQTNGHNHAVDETDSRVEQLEKRYQSIIMR